MISRGHFVYCFSSLSAFTFCVRVSLKQQPTATGAPIDDTTIMSGGFKFKQHFLKEQQLNALKTCFPHKKQH